MSLDSMNKVVCAGQCLLDRSKTICERTRALFLLKNVDDDDCVDFICQYLKSDDGSLLLKHEAAYCLGQMDSDRAFPTLLSLLKDESQPTIVRHESAESLGAIQSMVPNVDVEDVLEEFSKHNEQAIAETCQLSLARRRHIQTVNLEHEFTPFGSIDPALPFDDSKSIKELESIVCDETLSMELRYRAMFSLRNTKSVDAAQALSRALVKDKSSALFRHEVAFVLGQLQNDVAVDALITCLDRRDEDAMVRHECAEALGAIATPNAMDRLRKCINEHKNETDIVVESCRVALDISDYQQDSAEFQYASVVDGSNQ